MKLNKVITSLAGAAMLGGAMLSAPAAAQGEQIGFSALKGVEAQTLSANEMKSISGQLNAYDIAAHWYAAAERREGYPLLQKIALAKAEFYTNNAVQLNAAYERLGVLTPCQTCAQ
jgi:hypothetical protein